MGGQQSVRRGLRDIGGWDLVFEINRAALSEGFYPHSRHREYRQLYNRALSSEDRHRADADAPPNGNPQHGSRGTDPHPHI